MAGAGLQDAAGLCRLGQKPGACAELRYEPAPTKLYLPIVSVVAALSKRNDSFDLARSQYMLTGVCGHDSLTYGRF